MIEGKRIGLHAEPGRAQRLIRVALHQSPVEQGLVGNLKLMCRVHEVKVFPKYSGFLRHDNLFIDIFGMSRMTNWRNPCLDICTESIMEQNHPVSRVTLAKMSARVLSKTRATLYVPRTVLDSTRTYIFCQGHERTGWFWHYHSGIQISHLSIQTVQA